MHFEEQRIHDRGFRVSEVSRVSIQELLKL
jgi:hypothetical protein